MEMCPVSFRSYLRMQKDSLPDHDKLKSAINDWLGFPENQVRSSKLAALEPIMAALKTDKWEEEYVVMDEETEQKSKFQIVGDIEADFAKGRISLSSPLARALIGKSVGDTVEVNTPSGGRTYEITKVEYK